MNDATAAVIVAAISYLIGAIPFGYLIPKWVKGIDIREHGSGNPGATNVLRTMGNEWGILVLCLDLLKGLLPVWLLPMWLLPSGSPIMLHVRVLAGVAAIVGHMLPVYLRFRGGKGVATALGVVTVLGGWGTPVAVAVFLVTFLAWRMVALSSMLAVSAFAIAQLAMLYPYPSQTWSLLGFSVTAPLLIIYRHRGNIVRLWNREEVKIEFGKHSSAMKSDPPGDAGEDSAA
jgi:glycerol-3-phosphate acyltransferase PlsY